MGKLNLTRMIRKAKEEADQEKEEEETSEG